MKKTTKSPEGRKERRRERERGQRGLVIRSAGGGGEREEAKGLGGAAASAHYAKRPEEGSLKPLSSMLSMWTLPSVEAVNLTNFHAYISYHLVTAEGGEI